MEDSQNGDVLIRYFVPDLVVAHQYSPNFTRLELNQPGAQTGVSGNPCRACNQLSNDPSRGGDVDCLQEFVEPNEVRLRTAGPS